MAKHWKYSMELKRQVAREYLGGDDAGVAEGPASSA